MGEERWFYRSAAEWNALAERLKLTPCPHCQVVGALIRHGYLRGYDESSPQRKTVRARRIFCSNRNARRGCGRTFSVWIADKIRRLSLTTGALWRTLQRIWQRFDRGQSKIRTALSGRCPPPALSAQPGQRPAAQVLAHLHAAFPDACPI